MSCCTDAIEADLRANKLEREASADFAKSVEVVARLQERIAELEAARRKWIEIADRRTVELVDCRKALLDAIAVFDIGDSTDWHAAYSDVVARARVELEKT